ncbi:MAG: PKD domain-containing protein [Solirubrobacteraceae bacterium]|nr:PKD domain-containing protein [Solirubrobacteraceae bacterium]
MSVPRLDYSAVLLRLFAGLLLVAALFVGTPSGAVAATPPPPYDAPTASIPGPCPYVFRRTQTGQRFPLMGWAPCVRMPGTPVWLQASSDPTTDDFGAPIRVTMAAVRSEGRVRGQVSVTLPQGTINPSASVPGNSILSGVGLYVPGEVATYEWATFGSNSLLFANPQPVNPDPVSVSGWTLKWTSATAATISMDIDEGWFDRDRYFFFAGTTGDPGKIHDVVIRVPKQVSGTPDAKCTTTKLGSGRYRFSSTSTDPSGQTPTAQWQFDDGGTAWGTDVVKTFTTPGTHRVTLTATGPDAADSASCNVTVPWPKLGVSIDYPGGAPPFDENEPVPVRITVAAVGDGAIGQLNNVRFNSTPALTLTHGGLLRVTGQGVTFATNPAVTPAIPPAGWTLNAGQKRSFDAVLQPTGVGRFSLATAVRGEAPALNAAGTQVVNFVETASATNAGEVGDALDVDIALTPPSGAEQSESSTQDTPEPVDITATLTFTNRTGAKMTAIRLDDVDVRSTSRTAGAQDAFKVERIGGTAIPADGLPLDLPAGGLASGASIQRTYVFRASDDGDAEFSVSATGTRESGVQDLGSERAKWSLHPKYLLAIKTELIRPASVGTPLPAGETVRIKGTVKNLSGTDEVEVGPMYPELSGNAGAMSLAWDGTGTDPDEFRVPAESTIKLKPAQERTFTVRFTTGWSDPTQLQGEHKSGGTRATVKFTPWAKATDDEAQTRDVEAAEIKFAADQRQFNVTIDDSVTIPELEPFAFAGAIMYGGAQGAKNAAAAVALAPADLLIFSYTSLRAIAQFQTTMWNAFTEEEKDRFQRDVAGLAVEILKRNAEAAAMAPSQLFDQVYAAVGTKMTAQANAWEVGDWTSVVQEYSAVGADAVGQVVLPIAFAKLAKSAQAVAAIKRAQTALQAAFESTVGYKLASIQKIEELGPLLDDLKNGVELLPDQLDVLYGITPDELTELQRLATKHQFLLTVRSRHASSIRWIKEKGAMLKPEALKLKSVSELDTKLGYREADVGQLVFRKPQPLAAYEQAVANGSLADLSSFVDDYLDDLVGRGVISAGVERLKAAERIAMRTKEWRKHAQEYKAWSKLSADGNSGQGFIDVSFNWKGNAISDTVRKGTGKYVGFRLKKIAGDGEAYVIEMMDHRFGRWVPVTGDIDPIAFTLLDGAPLSEAQHADLLDDMRKSPLLRAQHPESATFVGVKPGEHDGVQFVNNQFKPGEPGLQIAPGGHLPRVVRLNSALSEWNNPFDYHLHWDGGFIYSGTHVPRGAHPIPLVDFAEIQAAQYQQAAVRKAQKLAPTIEDGPTVGSCKVTYSTSPQAQPLILTGSGQVARVTGGVGGAPVAIQVADDLTSACFGPPDGSGAPKPSELIVSPMTQVIGGSQPGATEIEVDETAGSAAKSVGDGALQVGQEVVIGAGTDHAEVRTITGFNSIIVDRPLEFAHEDGEAIVVVSTPAPTGPGGGGGPSPGGGSGPGPGLIPGGGPFSAPLVRPRGLKKPTIKGKARAGRKVTCQTGTWSGSTPLTYAFTWERKTGRTWKAIRRQTKPAYKLVSADRRREVRCAVTARNGAGAETARSKPVRVAAR